MTNKKSNEHIWVSIKKEQLEAFQRDGFLIVPGALSATEVEELVDIGDALLKPDSH